MESDAHVNGFNEQGRLGGKVLKLKTVQTSYFI